MIVKITPYRHKIILYYKNELEYLDSIGITVLSHEEATKRRKNWDSTKGKFPSGYLRVFSEAEFVEFLQNVRSAEVEYDYKLNMFNVGISHGYNKEDL
jgi:hypothetical protein